MLTVKQLLCANPDPMYIKDEEGNIVLANEAYFKLYGLSAAEQQAKQAHFFDYTFERDLSFLQTGTAETLEERYKLPGGNEVWFLTTLTVLQDAEGKNYLLASSADITRLKQRCHNLERQVANQIAPTVPPPNEALLYDFSGLGELASDIAFQHKMMRLFLDTVPEQLNQVLLAAHNRNWSQVAHTAHRLKSIYGNIKVQQAAEAMRKIEEIAAHQANEEKIEAQWKIAHQISLQVICQFEITLLTAKSNINMI